MLWLTVMSFLSSFDRDPFRAHNEHMRHMMRSFSEPFGGHFMPSITDGRDRGRRMPGQPGTNMDVRNPFSMFDSMAMNMRSRMEDMHKNFVSSNTHSFSSSSVMTYSKVGNEPPKVFQASSQTRRAPGGIKETRRALRDSESGLEKMSIGHHIQDRGHVVEKKQNKKTGEREFIQDFQNMDESVKYHLTQALKEQTETQTIFSLKERKINASGDLPPTLSHFFFVTDTLLFHQCCCYDFPVVLLLASPRPPQPSSPIVQFP
uniref:Myeloid leukemia factor 1 n=1 Tax=Myripristis murdjan TaxID=586833 RepID=A0A667YKQ6_9TELE